MRRLRRLGRPGRAGGVSADRLNRRGAGGVHDFGDAHGDGQSQRTGHELPVRVRDDHDVRRPDLDDQRRQRNHRLERFGVDRVAVAEHYVPLPDPRHQRLRTRVRRRPDLHHARGTAARSRHRERHVRHRDLRDTDWKRQPARAADHLLLPVRADDRVRCPHRPGQCRQRNRKRERVGDGRVAVPEHHVPLQDPRRQRLRNHLRR